MTTVVWNSESLTMAADRRSSRGPNESNADATKITHYPADEAPWIGGKRIRLIGAAGNVQTIEAVLEHILYFHEGTRAEGLEAAHKFLTTDAGAVYLRLAGRVLVDADANFLLVAEDGTAAQASAADILGITHRGRLLAKEYIPSFRDGLSAIGSGSRWATMGMSVLGLGTPVAVMFAATEDSSTGTEVQTCRLNAEGEAEWYTWPRMRRSALREMFQETISFNGDQFVEKFNKSQAKYGSQQGERYVSKRESAIKAAENEKTETVATECTSKKSPGKAVKKSPGLIVKIGARKYTCK